MQAMPDFRLEVHLAKWEFQAAHHLTASDAESVSIGDLLALAEPADREAMNQLRLSYTETWGSPQLRAAIAATHEKRTVDDVLCFSGAEEGLYTAMHTLLRPDDHAIVVTPNYQSAESVGAEGTVHLPNVADVYERGLSLGVMSKAYGLPGLRIGWIVSQDREALQRMERMKHYLSICNSAPSELLALIALKNGERLLKRNRMLVTKNLDLLDRFFAAHADLFEWRRSDGGCVAYPRYLGRDGVERFAVDLVETAGVLVLPASIYRSQLTPTPVDRFRIGFGRIRVEAGLHAFEGYLARRQHA